MSLVDEVLAEHQRRECFCGCGDVGCPLCGDGWPCESVRLALSLRAAEKVLESIRDNRNVQPGVPCSGSCVDKARRALAEYDKGGQG